MPMHIYIHVCTHVDAHVYTHVLYTCLCTRLYTCLYTRLYTCLYACVHTCLSHFQTHVYLQQCELTERGTLSQLDERQVVGAPVYGKDRVHLGHNYTDHNYVGHNYVSHSDKQSEPQSTARTESAYQHDQCYTHAICLCIDMCINMCIDMCIDMRIDMCV